MFFIENTAGLDNESLFNKILDLKKKTEYFFQCKLYCTFIDVLLRVPWICRNPKLKPWWNILKDEI